MGVRVKDPSTGQFKEVYVKALDSMPVGAEIDFDGDSADIPDGWEVVSGKSLVAYDLYNNASGSNGNITLSDSAGNYDYLMVFYKSTYNLTRQGVSLAPNNGNWSLFTFDIDANTYNTIYANYARYSINGTSMNLSSAKNYSNQNNNVLYITKVVGYKEV